MFDTIFSLAIISFFIWGFHKDGILYELQYKKLRDLTVNDFVLIIFGIALILVFIKLLADLF